MTNFTVHTKQTAPEKSAKVLDDVKDVFGFIPNLLGVMAESPQLAQTYLGLSKTLRETSLLPQELNLVWLTINAYNNCHYCMAAHSAIAAMDKVPRDVVTAARAEQPQEDARLEALRIFTLSMLENRGWQQPEEIETFLAAGYTRQNIFEVILTIAHKTMSNYTNHIANTPLDDAFKPMAWEKMAQAAE